MRYSVYENGLAIQLNERNDAGIILHFIVPVFMKNGIDF